VARVRAPELIGAGGWIGTVTSPALRDLLGKVVLLDFWTSSSINCLRLLEELRPIEARFAAEMVLIGIHSPKFPHEHDHATVEQATSRLRINHLVLDDPDLATWRQYGVAGWPTIVVIDPEGYVVGGISGEGCGPLLLETIEGLIATHEPSGVLSRDPVTGVPWGGASVYRAPSLRTLEFPANVAADQTGTRIAVADTGHDRVLLCDAAGRALQVFADLTAPRGLCFDGDRLVVCDAGADRVMLLPVDGSAPAVLATTLASPWDVAVESDGVFMVAEAGRHRLWRVFADGRPPEIVAGTGEADLVDGVASNADAGGEGTAAARLAQPSGLARFDRGFVFVDSDSSALRVLTSDQRVVTLVGQGLFDWGASDGGPESSALQHPRGVACPPDGSVFYVADTFNSMLRAWSGTELDASSGTLRTLPVEGLDEPGGLDILADGRLLVADTNHHRIVIVDPTSGVVEPLDIDEAWLGMTPGESMSDVEGATLALPFAVELGAFDFDRSVGPPVRLSVRTYPPTLLGPGPRQWELADAEGVLEVKAGQPGQGMLVIEAAVSVSDDTQSTVLRATTRHELAVSAASAVAVSAPETAGGEGAGLIPSIDPGAGAGLIPGTETGAVPGAGSEPVTGLVGGAGARPTGSAGSPAAADPTRGPDAANPAPVEG
jgi:DNA-binding beta-propeller fold protein YncE